MNLQIPGIKVVLPDIMRDVSRLLFLGVLDLANDESLVSQEMFLIQ